MNPMPALKVAKAREEEAAAMETQRQSLQKLSDSGGRRYAEEEREMKRRSSTITRKIGHLQLEGGDDV